MSKIFTLDALHTISLQHKNEGKSVGLVVGSFDILHLGHINLFRLAKKHVDTLFVGLDHDEIIKKTKGTHRPVNTFGRRADMLSDLTNIDGIFLVEELSEHGSAQAFTNYVNVLNKISPTHIFTHQVCDKHWKPKAEVAKSFGIKIVFDKSTKITNSGTILKLLETEF